MNIYIYICRQQGHYISAWILSHTFNIFRWSTLFLAAVSAPLCDRTRVHRLLHTHVIHYVMLFFTCIQCKIDPSKNISRKFIRRRVSSFTITVPPPKLRKDGDSRAAPHIPDDVIAKCSGRGRPYMCILHSHVESAVSSI